MNPLSGSLHSVQTKHFGCQEASRAFTQAPSIGILHFLQEGRLDFFMQYSQNSFFSWKKTF